MKKLIWLESGYFYDLEYNVLYNKEMQTVADCWWIKDFGLSEEQITLMANRMAIAIQEAKNLAKSEVCQKLTDFLMI